MPANNRWDLIQDLNVKISPEFIGMARVKYGIFKENQHGNRDLHPLSKQEK